MAIGTPVELGNNGNAIGTTLIITTGAVANVGDTIIVAISGPTANTVSSVQDSAGNTYVDDRDRVGTNHNGWVYRASVTIQLSSGGTITINKTNNGITGAAAIAVSGLDTATPLDATGAANGSSTTPSASATTANAIDIVVGMVGWETFSLTQPGGAWNALTGNTGQGTAKVGWAYQIVAATNTYTYDPTINLAAAWADVVVSYKAAVAAGGLASASVM